MKRLDNDPSEMWIKIGIMGDSGEGKTWAATTAPNVLVAAFERQANAAIRASCAARNLPVPTVLGIDSINDLGNIIRAFHRSRREPFVIRTKPQATKGAPPPYSEWPILVELERWPDTFVIDSVTDACDMMRNELHREAPPQKDKETGLPDDSFAHRRVLTDRCAQMFKSIRNIPAHVIFLALRSEVRVYQGRKEVGRRFEPTLPAKELAAILMATTNAFGSMYVAPHPKRGGALEYAIRFAGQQGAGVKNFPPLRRFEVPNVSEWIGRIQGTWKAPVSDAPPEPEDIEPPPAPAATTTEAAAGGEEKSAAGPAAVGDAFDLPFELKPEGVSKGKRARGRKNDEKAPDPEPEKPADTPATDPPDAPAAPTEGGA